MEGAGEQKGSAEDGMDVGGGVVRGEFGCLVRCLGRRRSVMGEPRSSDRLR